MFVSCHFLLLPETATKKARTNEAQFRHTCFGLSCLVKRPCTQHCCCVSVSPLLPCPLFPQPMLLHTAKTKTAEVSGLEQFIHQSSTGARMGARLKSHGVRSTVCALLRILSLPEQALRSFKRTLSVCGGRRPKAVRNRVTFPLVQSLLLSPTSLQFAH